MVDPPCEIRPATMFDLPAMHRIRNAAYAPIYASFRSMLSEEVAAVVFANAESNQGAYLDGFVQLDANKGALIGVLESRIVGFCAYILDPGQGIGTIDLNAVDPTHASRGIGHALYTSVLKIMKQEGMVVAQVTTGGDTSHAPARRAYAKVGLIEAIPTVLLSKAL